MKWLMTLLERWDWTLQPKKEHSHSTTLTWPKKAATPDFNCTVPTRLLLTSFILEALNAGVRMLLTLFQRSFFNISRQSLMGLVRKRKFFTKSTQTTHMHYSYIIQVRIKITSKQQTILFGKLLKSLTITCFSMSGSATTTTGLRPK